VDLKRSINGVLARTTGYELRRPAPAGSARGARRDRLLKSPVFVLSSVRSGSTLLRVLLDSHSQIHAPHELHLRNLSVRVRGRHTEKSLRAAELDPRSLEYLLWDRVLHRELARSGKRILVNKTPTDVFIADRILECWPDARFVFLLRHPLATARSRRRARPQDTEEHNLATVLRFCEAVEAARRAYPGLIVRYEDLAADPAAETRRLCEFLGVGWEPEMLEYGTFRHGRFRPGLGDWSENIKSGRVQPPRPLPAPGEVPPELRGITAAWGYARAPQQTPSP
jgi:hypothetical protein